MRAEPLETLPACKKDKIKPAGQLQMQHERQEICKTIVFPKTRTFFFFNIYWGQYLQKLKKEHQYIFLKYILGAVPSKVKEGTPVFFFFNINWGQYLQKLRNTNIFFLIYIGGRTFRS